MCRYVHHYSSTYAASNAKGSRTKGVVALGRSCRMSSCSQTFTTVDRPVWAVPVQWHEWAVATGKWWPLFQPPSFDLGKKRSRNQGIEVEEIGPRGQGTTLHHPFIKLQLAAALPPNANHPRASTANSTVLARQARDENLTWGWIRIPQYVPSLPPFVCLPLWSLLVASPPPIPGRQHPCP